MSRKRRHKLRKIQCDPLYNSELVSKFVNKTMLDGKKSIAQRIVYKALNILSERTKENELAAFEMAINNVKPIMEVKSRRVGGSTYQVPMEVRPERALGLAMKWIILNAQVRNGKSMFEKLGDELFDSYRKMGNSIKKREDTHKMAEANKAFAHFRW